jgi:hypothetical protein
VTIRRPFGELDLGDGFGLLRLALKSMTNCDTYGIDTAQCRFWHLHWCSRPQVNHTKELLEMKKLGIVAALAIILSGCAASMIEKGLGALEGKDVKGAFNVLGYPSGKQEFGSETVYFWSVK